MTVCPYEGCDFDIASHRPYARKRDGIPSASTVASLVDTGKSRSFGWAASLIAAVEAVHRPDNWSGLVGVMSDRAVKNGFHECTHEKDGLCKACTYLRSEFDRQWKAKANLGTHVHHLALSWAEGVGVVSDPVIDPYLDALEAFYQACQPRWLELERTILYNEPRGHAYRGQFDGIASILCPTCGGGARCRYLIDYKSGQYHPVEQTLQLAGYRYAQHITSWDGPQERIDKPMPTVDHAGVLMLSGEGTFDLIELPANRDAHGTFLRLRDVMTWANKVEAWDKDRKEQVKGEAA